MKIFKNAISHDGCPCNVHHFDVDDLNGIPDEKILKAHAVCFCDGKMLLVNHGEWDIWGIPGGTRDPGESIEQTLKREILEETNCEVLEYKPISYQKIISSDDAIHYRIHYICNVIPLGDFEMDIDGSVHKIKWIDPGDFKKYIEKKEFREVVIQRAISLRAE